MLCRPAWVVVCKSPERHCSNPPPPKKSKKKSDYYKLADVGNGLLSPHDLADNPGLTPVYLFPIRLSSPYYVDKQGRVSYIVVVDIKLL